MKINWGIVIGILISLLVMASFIIAAIEQEERTQVCEDASGEWSAPSKLCIIDNVGYEVIFLKNKWVVLNGERK